MGATDYRSAQLIFKILPFYNFLMMRRYGGVGGRGGDVYAQATEDYTLTDVLREYPKKRVIAMHGKHSNKRYILGPSGDHLSLMVPAGCKIIRADGKSVGSFSN